MVGCCSVSTRSVTVSMFQRTMQLHTVIFLLATAGCLFSGNILQAEIERATTESQDLARELSDLLDLLQSNQKVSVAENVMTDIVLRIQEIAEAAEQENLIRLSEKVKGKRMEEEELTRAINDLQSLSSLLENRGKN